MRLKSKGYFHFILFYCCLVKANEQMEVNKWHQFYEDFWQKKGRSFLWRILANERKMYRTSNAFLCTKIATTTTEVQFF